MRKFLPLIILVLIIAAAGSFAYDNNFLSINNTDFENAVDQNVINQIKEGDTNPLAIEYIKKGNYPGSEIKIEETLEPGSNYKRYLASYVSDGLKIYGLLTVPNEASTNKKAPAIVFGHGYIQPEEYRTTERYVAHVDSLARAGYVVFKIDYRGHDKSEGEPSGAYFSPGYTIDTINAGESLKKLDYVNSNKIGAWGHSMAGMIVTRILVAKPTEFQAAVIWGGVVGSHEDLSREWWSKRRPRSFTPSNRELTANRPSRNLFVKEYGEPKEGNEFWDSISPKTYIDSIKTPIQLHHGEEDETVPVELSRLFAKVLSDKNKIVELYTYPGSDHNISQSFNLAMQRTIAFFDRYLK